MLFLQRYKISALETLSQNGKDETRKHVENQHVLYWHKISNIICITITTMYSFLESPIMFINKVLKNLQDEAVWAFPQKTQQLKMIPVMVRR